MTTWNIYRIVDHNECPPVTTFFDTSKHRHDCLKELRKSGKDLSLVDIDVVVVQRTKTDIVDFMNCVSVSPQFAFSDENTVSSSSLSSPSSCEPFQRKTFPHLSLVSSKKPASKDDKQDKDASSCPSLTVHTFSRS